MANLEEVNIVIVFKLPVNIPHKGNDRVSALRQVCPGHGTWLGFRVPLNKQGLKIIEKQPLSFLLYKRNTHLVLRAVTFYSLGIVPEFFIKATSP